MNDNTVEKMKAEREAAIAQQKQLPASERVKPMPSGKTAFPIGVYRK
jgi:hypothetical protein